MVTAIKLSLLHSMRLIIHHFEKRHTLIGLFSITEDYHFLSASLCVHTHQRFSLSHNTPL